MAIYVNFVRNGLVYIPGDCKIEGHEGWVEVLSLQVRPPTISPAVDPDDRAAPPVGGEMIIAKATDSASPRIAVASHDGTDMTVTFDLIKTDAKNPNANLRYSATDAIITQMSVSTSGDRTTEMVRINFTKVVMGVIPDGPDVSDHLPADVMGYDLGRLTPL